MKFKKIFIGFFLLFIFLGAIGIWYAPVLFKGFSLSLPGNSLVMARNFSETGIFSIENKLNVVLSSSLVNEEGVISGSSNKLTSFLYAGLWNLFGPFSVDQLLLICLIVSAAALIIFTIVVADLFGYRIAFYFALIYILLPFNWQLVYSLGGYEFALLFVGLFFYFFLQAQKKNLKKYSRFFLILAGIFLTAAIFAKEAFILLPPFLILFLFWKKRKEAIIFIFIPFVLLMGFFWLPQFVESSNFNLLPGVKEKQSENVDFSFYGHLYPDPYTYHFDREVFLQETLEDYNQGELSVQKIGKSKAMKNVGVRKVSFWERLKVSLTIGARHVFRFFSLEYTGGPFVFLLMIFGFFCLRKRNQELSQFFIGWISFSILMMSLVLLLIRNHLMDFNWAIALTIALGILVFSQMILKYFNFKENKLVWLQLFILFLLLYNFILANHVVLGRVYDQTKVLEVRAYAEEINSINIQDKEVIALDVHGSSLYQLNYLTNKSLVIFREKTINKLIQEDKLNQAFEKFNVKYILGYSEDLSNKILENSEVENIVSTPIDFDKEELSRNRGWLMNLIR